MEQQFMTPPNHVNFKAKKLFGDGKIPHSVWNNIEGETVMIGISVE